MNGFKKLVLASAVLAATSGAYAMEAMDDESMSVTTGQDGLTIDLTTNIDDLRITYVDRDGYGASNFTSAGAVIIGDTADNEGIDIVANTRILIDAGGNDPSGTTGSGMLNINITSLAPTVIGLQNVDIAVADADATGSATGTAQNIISFDASASLTIAAGGGMNIQLGNEDQGHMIVMQSNIPSIVLTGLAINDVNSSGSIGIGTLSISGLNVNATVDVQSNGLLIDTTNTAIGQVGLEDVSLGTAASIGDIYLDGLDISGTVLVRGH